MARRGGGESGAALVELAICLPFLAIIVLGTIDLGRVFQTQQQLKNAARQGAVYAARYPGRQTTGATCTPPSTIVWQANNEGKKTFTILVNGAAPTCIAAPSGTLAAGQPIKITASTTFTPITPMAARIFGAQPTISASVCISIAGATPHPTATCA